MSLSSPVLDRSSTDTPRETTTLKFTVGLRTRGPRRELESALDELAPEDAAQLRELSFSALNRSKDPRALLSDDMLPLLRNKACTAETLHLMRAAEALGKQGCFGGGWGVPEVAELSGKSSTLPGARTQILDLLIAIENGWVLRANWPAVASGIACVAEHSDTPQELERNLASLQRIVNGSSNHSGIGEFMRHTLPAMAREFDLRRFSTALECCAHQILYADLSETFRMAVAPLVRRAQSDADLDAIATFAKRLSVQPIAVWGSSDSARYLFYSAVRKAAVSLSMPQLVNSFELIEELLDTAPPGGMMKIDFGKLLGETLPAAAARGQFDRAISFTKEIFYSGRSAETRIPSPGFELAIALDPAAAVRDELLGHVRRIEVAGGWCPPEYLKFLNSGENTPREPRLTAALDDLFSTCSSGTWTAAPVIARLETCRNMEEQLALIEYAARIRPWTTLEMPKDQAVAGFGACYQPAEGAYRWALSWGVELALRESAKPSEFASTLESVSTFFKRLSVHPVIFSAAYEVAMRDACETAVRMEKAGLSYQLDVTPQRIDTWMEPTSPYRNECYPAEEERSCVGQKQSISLTAEKR